MKSLVYVDIAGVAGVVHPEQAQPGGAERRLHRRPMPRQDRFRETAAARGGTPSSS